MIKKPFIANNIHFHLLTIIALLSINAYPNNGISSSVHWLANGDKVTKTHYEFVDMPTDTTVWDFSHAIETGESHDMRWLNLGDFLLVRIEQGSQSTYGYRNAAGYHYYINDYQGNVRAVVDGSGTLEEVNSYYPYGALMGGGIANGVQPYKYGGKELDRQAGIDWYDSHARWYDSLIGQTPTQDRLAEKYYSISPYAWCAANPIRFIDFDGNKIVFAINSSKEFKEDYKTAYNYLNNKNASYILDQLNALENVFYLKEYEGDSYYNSQNKTIYWNSKRALITNTIYTLTPAELLSHEADHALENDKDCAASSQRNNTINVNYGNEEEKRVIEGSEQEVAKKLGRLKNGEKTRTDHNGTSYNVSSPDSDEIEGLIITGNN